MAEQDKPFVINDRRKFRMDGELREPQPAPPADSESDADTAAALSAAETATGAPVHIPREDAHKPADGAKVVSIAEGHHEPATPDRPRSGEHASEPIPFHSHTVTPEPEPDENASAATAGDENLPPPPTPEEIEQVKRAYEATAERLETVMRATNPGGDHLPPMDFTRLVQSIYMSAMVQMGAGTPQGEQARVDLIGAKQSIDMLQVIADKAGSSLDSREQLLMDSALFELRMGFLEITQMLARQAASRQGAPGMPGAPVGGPRIVT